MPTTSTSTLTWEAGSGRRLSLILTLDDARSCSHQGQCDSDVSDLMSLDRISQQLEAWDPQELSAELAEYGAWDSKELADHDANLTRMVWLACCDVAENPAYYAD